MKEIKDKKVVILIIILIVFTISYFIIVNKVSYAFEFNNNLEDVYENRVETIEKCAEMYGRNNIESFNEEGVLYITVQTLIDNRCLFPNEEGNIEDVLNKSEYLNSKKIRIKNESGNISAEIYS